MLTPYDFGVVVQKRKGIVRALWGEAGVGKTHAAARLLAGLPCRTLSTHATTPLSDLARTLPEPKRLAAWASRTRELLEQGEPLGADRAVDALVAILSNLAPFVLYLEDLHEADDERRALIYALAGAVQKGRGVGLLVTSRTRVDEPFQATRLEPLGADASRQLLEAQLGAALPEEAARWVYGKAAGNPLYSLEYVRFLARRGHLWSDGSRWHWRRPDGEPVPVTVEALIEQQLDEAGLEPDLAAALEGRAVLPLNATDAQWAAVAGLSAPALAAAKLELARRGLLREDSFVHPLYREVTANGLPQRARQALSRRLLEVFADDPAQVARAVGDAGLAYGHALELLERAAAQATDAGDEGLAGELLEKASSYATGERRAELMLGAASALQHRNPSKAVRLLETLLKDEPNNTEAVFLCMFLHARDGNEEATVGMFARLASEVRASPRGIEALLEAQSLLGHAHEALALWQQHRELTFRPDVVARVVYTLSGDGQYDTALDLVRTTLARTDLSIWERAVLTNALGTVYIDDAEHEHAEAVFGELLELLSHVGNRRAHVVLSNRATARKFLGRYLEAKQDALEGYRLASEAGDGYMVGSQLGGLAELEMELGDYVQAEEYVREALTALEQRHISRTLIETQITASELYSAWRRPQSGYLALKHARAALRYARELDNPLSLIYGLHCAALAEASFGSSTNALELAEELGPLAAQNGSALGRYYADWAKATALRALGRNEEAKAFFQQAFEQAQKVKHAVNAHKIGLELDRLDGDLESARTRAAWFRERSLMNGVNLAGRYFPELADAPPQPPTAEHLLRLEVLGTMRMSTRGGPVAVRGGKRQELLALLLDARLTGRAEVSRLELFDALYLGEDERRAAQNLKTLVHGLRTQLGGGALMTTMTGYALGAIASDAETFLETRDTRLWRGPYLEGVDLEGRETVRESLVAGLAEGAALLLRTDPREAARAGGLALEHDPYNPEHLSLCLRALRAGRNHKSLGRLYAEAKTRFAEVGEVLPETWQSFLG